jgi:hypothetical protein
VAVHARIFPTGLIRIAGSGADIEKLLACPYLRREGRLWKTKWTYAPDLRRDFPEVVFREGSGAALQHLVRSIEESRRGDDARVRSWFDPSVEPKPFQYPAIHFGLNQKRVVLADGVGLGKTIEAMGVMLGAFALGLARRAAICVPASLKTQWFRELHDKANPRVLPAAVKIATGTPRERLAIYRSPWRVLILSHDICRIDADLLEGIARTIDLAILDEASILKNGVGPTYDAITRSFRFSRFRLALTATPIENGLLDLYHVFRWVDRAVFMSQLHFNDRYVLFRRQRFTVKKRGGAAGTVKLSQVVPWKYQNLNEVKAKIRPSFIRRTAKEVGVQLPRVSVHARGPRARGGAAPGLRSRARSYEAPSRGQPGARGRGAHGADRRAAAGVRLHRARPGGRGREAVVGEGRAPQGAPRRRTPGRAGLDLLRLRALRADPHAGAPQARAGLLHGPDEREGAALRDRRLHARPTPCSDRDEGDRSAATTCSRAARRQRDLPWNPAALKQRLGRLRRLESKHEVIRVRDLAADDTVETKLIAPKLDDKHKLAEDVLGEDELSRPAPDHAGLTARNVRDLI